MNRVKFNPAHINQFIQKELWGVQPTYNLSAEFELIRKTRKGWFIQSVEDGRYLMIESKYLLKVKQP